jgi:hypothetical protein
MGVVVVVVSGSLRVLLRAILCTDLRVLAFVASMAVPLCC